MPLPLQIALAIGCGDEVDIISSDVVVVVAGHSGRPLFPNVVSLEVSTKRIVGIGEATFLARLPDIISFFSFPSRK